MPEGTRATSHLVDNAQVSRSNKLLNVCKAPELTTAPVNSEPGTLTKILRKESAGASTGSSRTSGDCKLRTMPVITGRCMGWQGGAPSDPHPAEKIRETILLPSSPMTAGSTH